MKKIKAIVKLILNAGQATPVPPIGPILGQYGINLLNFCKDYNSKTSKFIGTVIPIKMFIYDDRSYNFILKTSPTSKLILKYLNLKKGSSNPKKDFIGTITNLQIKEIAKLKLNDLNTNNLENAISIIIGTLKNMGIQIIK
jgi:large subunit ribosomal protein L11